MLPTLTNRLDRYFFVVARCFSIVQMGPSGSGKTSLLNVLAQRVPPKNVAGGVFVDGSPLSKSFKRRMGFVFQVRYFLRGAVSLFSTFVRVGPRAGWDRHTPYLS